MLNATQKRAKFVEKAIRAQIDAGKFKLDVGYLSDLAWVEGEGLYRRGCALAAAAFALTNGEVQYAGGQNCRQLVSTKLTATDTAQLEMGYENWTRISFQSPKNGKFLRFLPRPQHPFYKLGAKLRRERRNK